MSQFPKEFYRLKLQHQVQILEKETQIEAAMDKLKIRPQTKKFIKDALEWNTNLKQQQEDLCHKILVTTSYYDTSNILI